MSAKQNIQDIYRLSPIQEGLLFHSLRSDDANVYVEQFSHVVEGRVTPQIFEQAWQLAIQRHDILRTGFVWQGVDKPVQVVFKSIDFSLQVHDFSTQTSEAYQQALHELKHDLLNDAFELKKPPLMRFALVFDPQGNSRMIWTYHHLLLDGWSAFLVLGEVLRDSLLLSEGQQVAPSRAPSYKQFVKWQAAQDEAAAIAYWESQLGDFSAPTPLGIPQTLGLQQIDPAQAEYVSLSFTLGASLGQSLERLAQSTRVTVGTLLQAAWAYWLAVSSREDDVTFGVTLSGRSPDLPQSEAIAGLFINTLPCRVKLPLLNDQGQGDTLKEWLQQLQQAFVRLRQFEYTPLTTIRRCTQVTQDTDLFHSMLAIESFPFAEAVQLTDVEVTQKTNYPLTIVIEPSGDYRVRMMFDTGQYTRDVIRNVFEQYQAILSQFPQHLGLTVQQLSLMSPQAREQQNQWNDTQVTHPGYSISEGFARQVALRPQATAIVAGFGEQRQRLSYQGLDQQASQLARYLIECYSRKHEVAHDAQASVYSNPLAGQRIALCYAPSVEQMVALMAITKLGAAYVPIDASLPRERMLGMVRRLPIDLLLTNDAQVANFDAATTRHLDAHMSEQIIFSADDEGVQTPLFVVNTQQAQSAIEAQDKTTFSSPLVAGHVLYIAHTSGSTGIPKAAGVYHDSFVNLLHWWNHTYAYTPEDKNLLINKLSFDLAQKNIWGALLTGGEQHLFTGERFDPQHINEHIHAEQITWINCTPSMGYALVESALALTPDVKRSFLPLRSMRYLFLGGEPVNKARVAPWMLDPQSQVQLVNTYGPTECTDLCCTHWFEREEFERLDDLVTVGRALPINLHLYVFDRFGKPLPKGVAGEVMIGGMSIGTGYLNNAEQTAEKFISDNIGPVLALDPNPMAQPPVTQGRNVPGLSQYSNLNTPRLYKTGDLGYFRDDGSIIVKGRVDFQVKLRGNRIELEEIDIKIRELPAVDDAVTIVSDDQQQLYSYVVLQPDALATLPQTSSLSSQDLSPQPSEEAETQYSTSSNRTDSENSADSENNPASENSGVSENNAASADSSHVSENNAASAGSSHVSENNAASAGSSHVTENSADSAGSSHVTENNATSASHAASKHHAALVSRDIPANVNAEDAPAFPDGWCAFGEIQARPDDFITQFEAAAKQYPESIVLRDVRHNETYHTLNQRANQWARYWKDHGIKPGEQVGVYIPRTALGIEMLLGLMKLGVAFMPMDDQYPVQRLQYMLEDSKTRTLVYYSKTPVCIPGSYPQPWALPYLEHHNGLNGVLVDNDTLLQVRAYDDAPIDPALRQTDNDISYIIYTSGSTGKPKGIAITHEAFVRYGAALLRDYPVDENTRMLQFSPISFDAWIQELLCGLLHGGSLCLLSTSAREPGEAFIDQVNALGATHALIPPSVLSFLDPELLPTLQHLQIGGEPCSLPLAQRWAASRQVYHIYGVSESTVISTIRRFTPEDTCFAIGKPLPDSHFYLLDEHQQPVADGEAGELYIGGRCLAKGYLHQAERTQERFLVDPFSKDTSDLAPRMYRTGDLMRRLADGSYEFINRVDHQVKVNGYRLELGEYDAQIASVDGVEDAVVIAKEVMPGNFRLGAFLRLADDSVSDAQAKAATQQKIIERVTQRLQNSMPVMPAQLRVIDVWPRTLNNKIDRQALSEQFDPLHQSGQNPSQQTADQKTQAWQAVRQHIMQHLKQRLPAYMLPSVMVQLEHMPLNANGKVDRSALPEIDAQLAAAGEETIAPRNDTEAAILAIWQTVLGREAIGVNDNFFEMGGHSLSITQTLSRLNKQFELHISLSQLFEHLTIEAQAQLVNSQQQQTADAQAEEGRDTENTSLHLNLNPLSFKRLPRSEHLPLSYSQSRLWFLNQFETMPAVYNIPNMLAFDDVVDITRLQQAIDALVLRHESLRTVFRRGADVGADIDAAQTNHASATQAQQVVLASMSVPVEHHDVRHLDEGRQADVLRRTATEQVMAGFDLSAGPLIRCALVQVHDTRAMLFITAHHIITDGWSGDILSRELMTLYQHPQAQLPALNAHYADYAIWQRHAMQSGAFQKQQAYWHKQLHHAPMTIDLPYDHPRPASMSNRGGLIQQRLTPALTDSLKLLAQQQNMTLFMLLNSILSLTLYRFSGQTDFSVGTPIANRHQQAFESIVGFFVNTLVLRTQLDPQWSLAQLLVHSKQTASDAFDHQDLPFETLVEMLNPVRDPALNPLFQVMFTLQTARGDSSVVNPEEWVARFDLQLIALDTQPLTHPDAINEQIHGLEGLQLNWEYSKDVFDRATAERIADGFIHIAKTLAELDAEARDSMPIYELSVNNSQQLRQIAAFEQGEHQAWSTQTLFDAWYTQVATQPDAPAIIAADETLTYQQLAERVELLAAQLCLLTQANIANGQQAPIAVCMPRSLGQVIAILAVMRAGAPMLAIDADYPPARIQYFLDDSACAYVLCSRDTLPMLTPSNTAHAVENTDAHTLTCVLLDAHSGAVIDTASSSTADTTASDMRLAAVDIAAASIDALPSLAPESEAYWIYTSGSTGQPKAIRVLHQGLHNTLMSTIERWQLDSQARMLQFASASFDAYWLEIGGGLMSGASVYLIDKDTQTHPQALGRFIARQQITHSFLPPSLLNFLPIDDCDSLVQLIVGGEACPLETAQRWHEGRRFMNGYGPSEITVFATIGEYQDGYDYFPIGKPLHNVCCVVLDEFGQRCPLGVVGELYIGGAGVSAGYAGRDALTAEKFVHLSSLTSQTSLTSHTSLATSHTSLDSPQNTRLNSDTRFYRTGDLVCWKPTGELEFMGRVDEQIKLRGQRIEAGEIEYQLSQITGVLDALVIKQNTATGDQLHAFMVIDTHKLAGTEALQASASEASVLTTQDSHEADIARVHLSAEVIADIKAALHAFLPAYMIPAIFTGLARWPLTPNDKINKRLLHHIHSEPVVEFSPPETALQKSLASLLADLFEDDVTEIGLDDDFFALGGHSLLATQLMAHIFEKHGFSVPLRDFFMQPSVRFLAEYIEAREAGHDVSGMRRDSVDIPWELDSQVTLPAELPALGADWNARLADKAPHVLLTGCTGFVGAYLIRETLARWPNATLYCHVRAKTAQAGLQRIQDNMQGYQIWEDAYAARIQPITGDLTANRLGIDEANWALLAQQVDIIVHNGAVMNHMADYYRLKDANLRSTKQLIELCAQSRLKQLVMVSTLGIFDSYPRKRTVDENIDLRQEGLLIENGYNGTKWVAELAVMNAIKEGIPARIVRPGRITVDSQTGASKADDLVGYYLSTQIQIQQIPRYKLEEPVVPADYVARSIIAVIPEHPEKVDAHGEPFVFHLSGKHKYNWSKLLKQYVDTSEQFETVMIPRWVDSVKFASREKPLPFAPYLFHIDIENEEPAPKKTTIDESQTLAYLAARGVDYPTISDDAWKNYIQMLFDTLGVRFTFKSRRFWEVF